MTGNSLKQNIQVKLFYTKDIAQILFEINYHVAICILNEYNLLEKNTIAKVFISSCCFLSSSKTSKVREILIFVLQGNEKDQRESDFGISNLVVYLLIKARSTKDFFQSVLIPCKLFFYFYIVTCLIKTNLFTYVYLYIAQYFVVNRNWSAAAISHYSCFFLGLFILVFTRLIQLPDHDLLFCTYLEPILFIMSEKL